MVSLKKLPCDRVEDERAEEEDLRLAELRQASAEALRIQHPELIIEKLDPQGLTAPYQPAPAAEGAPAETAAVIAPEGSWQSVATNVAAELGLDPYEVASVMSFESAGTFSPTKMGGDGGKYMGLIQFGPEERRTYGITKSSTPQEWTTAITRFMKDRGFKKGMGLEDFYSTILTGGPGRYDRTDSNGTSVRNAIPRILSEHMPNAKKWLGGAIGPLAGLMQVSSAIGLESLPPSDATQQPPLEVEGEQPPSMADIKTGVALLDDLNGAERMKLLLAAREQMNKKLVSRKAEFDVRLGNIQAEAFNGEIATPLIPDEELMAIYGPVEGPQRIAQQQQLKDVSQVIPRFRTQSAEAINTALAALAPTPGSPTYATELQIYDAATKARDALLAERESDPAAYAMKHFSSVQEAAQRSTSDYYAELDRVYETLGIDKRYAPVMSAQATERLIDDYKMMTPAQRRGFMAQNFASMGEDRFRRFVSNAEGTTMQADARMFALFRSYPSWRAGDVANVYQQVLEGREIIEKDPARRPQPSKVREKFIAEGINAINNLNADASLAIQEAAEALYVQRGGLADVIDAGLYREALKTALGGSLPANMAQGQAKDWTILPPKTTKQQFQGWVERQTLTSITKSSVEQRPPRYGDLKTAVPVSEIIDNGVFVMVSPGRYMVKMASDGRPLMTSTGRPFLVNINARDVLP